MSARGTAARRLILLAVLGLGILFEAPAQSNWSVDPPEWGFGRIPADEPVIRDVVVENRGREKLRVAFILTCDCLWAEPGEAVIRPGGKAVFRVHLDPAGYDGKVEKDLIVRFQGQSAEKALFHVFGEVERETADALPAPAAAPVAAVDGKPLRVDYYYSPGCAGCERFLAEEVPRVEAELGVPIEIRRRNIFEPAVYEEYLAVLETLSEQERAYPAVRIGAVLLQGEAEVESSFREALKAEVKAGGPDREPALDLPGKRSTTVALAVLPVAAAGLLDGVNPCAFATLLFLLSALAVAGKGRRDVLLIGLVFAASVFTSYFLIGLGFFQAVRLASAFGMIASALKWALAATLLIFAALSLYDYLLIRQGKTSRIVLQLPASFKRRIHDAVRVQVRSSALVGGTFVLGVLVSVFELACTGQVYLPTIVYLVRTERQLGAYLYLGLYNLAFIVPLLAVFAFSYAGVSSQRFTMLFRRGVGAVKLGLAVLFLTLATLTLLT